MCAIANDAALPAADVPWPPGNASGHQTNTFVEAGVDLTAVLGGSVPCFAFFQAETPSSAQLTATLKDFTGGNFNSCIPPAMRWGCPSKMSRTYREHPVPQAAP